MRQAQYGAQASAAYDLLFADPTSTERTVAELSGLVTGRDVLELGVGTGRIAAPLAPLVRSLVGTDNSSHMLDVFRGKGIPGNVTVLEHDFRDPLPGAATFDVAYSTLGSLACCASRAELVTALSHVRESLRPQGILCFEFYSRNTYLELIDRSGGRSFGGTTVDGGVFEVALSHDGATLTSTTTVRVVEESVTFTERVLLLSTKDVEASMAEAGFVVRETREEQNGPFDWYVGTVTERRK